MFSEGIEDASGIQWINDIFLESRYGRVFLLYGIAHFLWASSIALALF